MDILSVLAAASTGDYISWFFTGFFGIFIFGLLIVFPLLVALGIIKMPEVAVCPKCHKSDCDRWLHGEVH